MTCHNTSSTHRHAIDRRTLLKYSAVTGAALSVGLNSPAIAQTRAIKLGYVSPLTGRSQLSRKRTTSSSPISRKATKAGVKIGNATVPVEVVVKDSQSNPNRAAEVAKDLIVQDKIDLMLVASTPETTNPVSTQCEIEEVPCISTVAPWQPWFIGRQANPGGGPPAWKGFNYTYHFFWGLEDVIAVFTNMWSQVATNKSVGGLFPNDGDGNAWGDKVVGFPPVLDKGGYKLTDPAATRTSPTISPPRSARSNRRIARSSPAWCCRRISPPSGSRRFSKASGRKSRPSARRSSSPSPSRRWARTGTTCPPKSGGRRAIPSSRRSRA